LKNGIMGRHLFFFCFVFQICNEPMLLMLSFSQQNLLEGKGGSSITR
jgi:hypothetical protein